MLIKPQKGFQVDFLSSSADIVIGGGAAGAGKTYALVMEALRYISVPNFGATIFRRTSPQITNEGGLWDTTEILYSPIGMKPNKTFLHWEYNCGSAINKIKFSHLQHEKNIYDHQGSQIPLIGFDELTHFSEKMFFYMLSRNRTVCGVKPYVRATCNPDPDSWVKRFIQWWLDKDGNPIAERCGKLRYFTRDGKNLVWGDSAAEVVALCPHIFNNPDLKDIKPDDLIKSVTFIPGSIYMNGELLRVNPSYLGDLLAQDEETKSQLLDGNWEVKADGLCIYDHSQIVNIFTNDYVKHGTKYITVDAARFGSDKAVIWVWSGWRIIDCAVFDISSTTDIANKVKEFERKYKVQRSHTICDADGVGGGVIDQCPGMRSFVNNSKALPVKGSDENYDSLKTQCYYKSADKVNAGDVYMEEHVAQMDVGLMSVREYLSKDLRAIKKGKIDSDGKRCLIQKAQMKSILGRSPDFGDSFMQRVWFDLAGTGGGPRSTMTNKRR